MRPLLPPLSDYLFMNLVIAPYYPPDEDGSGSGGGHRRRLAAWVGQAVATHDAGGAGPPGGAYVDAQAHAGGPGPGLRLRCAAPLAAAGASAGMWASSIAAVI